MKSKNKAQKTSRNWALVIIASIVIAISVTLLVMAVVYRSNLGWWAPVLAVGAVISILLSVQAIKKNDPVWLLLDLILPG